jgi:NAD(P)-dependent dehydrogenase (short-subunit alcohol dehydrogenase family)
MSLTDHDGLAGRVAIVTGAASGIGRAVAERLADAGTHLVVADIDGDKLELLAESLQSHGIQAIAHTTDVSSALALEVLIDDALTRFGALHFAVNNAGISGPQAELADLSPDDWHRVVTANLSGVFYAMRSEIPALLSSGGGSIVNIASVLGQVGSALSPAYTAAKHGVVGLTRSAALAYASRGLRINAVGPGYIRTPMLEVLSESAMNRVKAAQPLGRLGDASEIAELVAFLLSKRASFTTGALYLADGGFTAA